MNIFLLEDGEAAPRGHTVQNVGGVILCCVLADDAIDQSTGTGPKQIDFDERILFLEHVDECLLSGIETVVYQVTRPSFFAWASSSGFAT